MFRYPQLFLLNSSDNLTPLVVMVFDYLIFKEKITLRQGIAGGVAFVGVCILTINSQRPEQTEFENYHCSETYCTVFAIIGIILNIFAYSATILITKKLKNVTQSQISFNYGITMLIANLALLPIIPDLGNNTTFTFIQFIRGIFFCGAFFAIGNLCEITALRTWKQSGIVVLSQFSVIGLAYLLSAFRYQEPLNLLCVIGTVLTMISGGLIIGSDKGIKKRQNQKKLQQQKTSESASLTVQLIGDKLLSQCGQISDLSTVSGSQDQKKQIL